jgi:ribonuclease III
VLVRKCSHLVRRRTKERETDAWIQEAEKKLGHRFRNRALLQVALTHPSAGGERHTFERLEFLGDAILTLLVSLHVYERYPDFPPGGLTRLRASMVNRPALARAATHLGLHTMIRMGKSEEPNAPGRPTLLAAGFEAVVAALYLDRGVEAVATFLERHLLAQSRPDVALDPKSELQNFVQVTLKMPPRYRLVRHSGPSHARRFEVEVTVKGEILGRGQGESRRAAERAAAQAALANWGKTTIF